MKIKAIILSLAVGATLLVGCGAKEEATTAPAKTPAKTEATTPAKTDAVTTASIVNDQATIEKAISKEGTWIILATKDMTVDKEMVLEGEFTKADKADATKKVPAGRKLILLTRDDKKVTTATFTLKAPKLTVKSENATIEGGTFVGDIYVEAKGFAIENIKIQGNVYFASAELKAAFKPGEGGSITGATEVKK
ncbi:MAG TPA: hypothetical protein VIK86_10215 [Candidatus Paceibacterota bacterium]